MSGADKAEVARFLYASTAVSSRVVPVTANVDVGDTVILVVNTISGGASNTTVSVSDGKGNTYTLRVGPLVQGPGNAQVSILVCDSIATALTTSDNFTITADVGGATWLVLGYSFTGLSGYDVGVGTTGTTSGINTGATGTAAQDAQLVFCGAGYTGTAVVFTPGSGFAAQAVATTTGTIRNLQCMWKYVSAPGTRSATATMDASHPWAAGVVGVNVTPTPSMVFAKTVTVGG